MACVLLTSTVDIMHRVINNEGKVHGNANSRPRAFFWDRSPACRRDRPACDGRCSRLVCRSHYVDADPLHCGAFKLLGLLIQSLAHMLANANLKDTVLIGARLAYAVVDLFSAMRRDATQSLAPVFRQAVLCCRVEAQLCSPRAKRASALRLAHRVNEFRERCTRAVVKVPAGGARPMSSPRASCLAMVLRCAEALSSAGIVGSRTARQCIPASGARCVS